MKSRSLSARLRRFAGTALASLESPRRLGSPPTTDSTFAPPRIAIRRRYVDVAELKRLFDANPRQAIRAVRTAAEHGIAAAQTIWGQCLLDGEFVPRDVQAAFRAFLNAAENGDLEARNMVGRCHEHGWGVLADQEAAALHYEKAAMRGHVWAKVNLAQVMMRRGHRADLMRCYELFRDAAAAGNLKAKNSLARFMEEGWSGERDLVGAARLYREAAEEGDHWAQFNLGSILLGQGAQTEAIGWLSRAVSISDDGFRRRAAPVLLSHSVDRRATLTP